MKQWGNWEPLGGICTDGAAVTFRRPNLLDAFVIGTDRSLQHNNFDGNNWSGWKSLGGVWYSAPAAIAIDKAIDLFAIDQDRALRHTYFFGIPPTDTDWANRRGICTDGVAVTFRQPDSRELYILDAFVIGTDRSLQHNNFDGNNWSGWESRGGKCYSAPAAVARGANVIDVCVIGTDRSLQHNNFDGNNWSGWKNRGGICNYGVAVASRTPDSLDVFTIATNGSMVWKPVIGTDWNSQDWEPLGGVWYSAPAAIARSESELDVFAIAQDRSLMWNSYR